MEKTELTTVPTFNFEQGDVFSGDGNSERMIQVKYWNYGDTIELCQGGNEVMILKSHLKHLFKEIQRHQADAEYKLKNR